jgi:hypothetical protein
VYNSIFEKMDCMRLPWHCMFVIPRFIVMLRARTHTEDNVQMIIILYDKAINLGTIGHYVS